MTRAGFRRFFESDWFVVLGVAASIPVTAAIVGLTPHVPFMAEIAEGLRLESLAKCRSHHFEPRECERLEIPISDPGWGWGRIVKTSRG